jgi:hypothetical protein
MVVGMESFDGVDGKVRQLRSKLRAKTASISERHDWLRLESSNNSEGETVDRNTFGNRIA